MFVFIFLWQNLPMWSHKLVDDKHQMPDLFPQNKNSAITFLDSAKQFLKPALVHTQPPTNKFFPFFSFFSFLFFLIFLSLSLSFFLSFFLSFLFLFSWSFFFSLSLFLSILLSFFIYLFQFVIPQWLVWQLATRKVPGTKTGKGEYF